MEDFIQLIDSENIDSNLKNYIIHILKLESISEQEYFNFIHNVKGKISPHLFKKVNKFIKKKIVKEKTTNPGPKYRNSDIRYLGGKIEDFFKSPQIANFPKNEKISFYLFGSLVNGYCNNPTKKEFGKPSDDGRISDVDILVSLSSDFFEQIFRYKSRILKKIHGMTRTAPIGVKSSFGPNYAGPFENLLFDLSKIRFAGRNDRSVNVVFAIDKLFNHLKMHKEPHIKILEIST